MYSFGPRLRNTLLKKEDSLFGGRQETLIKKSRSAANATLSRIYWPMLKVGHVWCNNKILRHAQIRGFLLAGQHCAVTNTMRLVGVVNSSDSR